MVWCAVSCSEVMRPFFYPLWNRQWQQWLTSSGRSSARCGFPGRWCTSILSSYFLRFPWHAFPLSTGLVVMDKFSDSVQMNVTPLDFFLWGHVKDIFFLQDPCDFLSELKVRIGAVIQLHCRCWRTFDGNWILLGYFIYDPWHLHGIGAWSVSVFTFLDHRSIWGKDASTCLRCLYFPREGVKMLFNWAVSDP